MTTATARRAQRRPLLALEPAASLGDGGRLYAADWSKVRDALAWSVRRDRCIPRATLERRAVSTDVSRATLERRAVSTRRACENRRRLNRRRFAHHPLRVTRLCPPARATAAHSLSFREIRPLVLAAAGDSRAVYVYATWATHTRHTCHTSHAHLRDLSLARGPAARWLQFPSSCVADEAIEAIDRFSS